MFIPYLAVMVRVTTAPCGVETSHDVVSSLTMALCRLRQLLHNTR